jgi:DeoR family ulaG and ulaABCDEF operon transcriptional repressor
MHEIERHRIILGEVAERPVVTVTQLVELTGASEATIRRDIGALHVVARLRRVRGGAEAIHPPQTVGIAGRPFSVNEGVNIDKKRAIARVAVGLCEDGESIIINGGTTTFQMVHHLARRRMQILTNSFPIAEHLLRNSKNTITLPGGSIYREQNIVLSPFENDVTRNFYARRMFMSAQGVSPIGVMEGDPLLIQAEQKLIIRRRNSSFSLIHQNSRAAPALFCARWSAWPRLSPTTEYLRKSSPCCAGQA